MKQGAPATGENCKSGGTPFFTAHISKTISGISVILAIAFIALVPGADAETGYEYLDTVPASEFGNVTGVSGAAELVSIDGTDYVRFTDTGTATVTASGRTGSFDVGPAHVKLIFITGQSNSCYFTAESNWDGKSPVEPGRCFFWGTEHTWDNKFNGKDPSGNNYTEPQMREIVSGYGIYDITDDNGNVRMAQMYPVLCDVLSEETDGKFLIANGGVGGRKIVWWNDGSLCDNWDKAVLNCLRDYLGDKIIAEPIAVIWSQGESDAGSSSTYYSRFVDLCGKFRSGYYGFEFPAVFCGLPKATGGLGDYDNMIIPARDQITASGEYPWIKIASSLAYRLTDDQIRSDKAHYTQQGYDWFAEAFARSISGYYGWNTVPETVVIAGQPDGGSVECYGTSGTAFSLPISGTAVTIPSGMILEAYAESQLSSYGLTASHTVSADHPVTYVWDGGRATFRNPGEGPYAEVSVLSASDVGASKTGYRFAGWTLNGETVGDTVTAGTAGITLYASWVRNSILVESIGPLDVTAKKTSLFNLPEVSASVFLSASEIPEGLSVSISGDGISVRAERQGTYSFVLTATADGFSAAEITVLVRAGPADSVVFTDGGKEIGTAGADEGKATAIGASKDGYRLKGWAKTEGGKAEISEGDPVQVPDGGTVLYAVWEKERNDWILALVPAGCLIVLIGYRIGNPVVLAFGTVAAAGGIAGAFARRMERFSETISENISGRRLE